MATLTESSSPTERSLFPVSSGLDRILAWSLSQRLLVLWLAAGLLVWGVSSVLRTPVQVLPDLSAPTVAVLVEAPGLTPEEVERGIALSLETALHGASGVRRIRSVVIAGFCVVWIEFDWDTPIFQARQIVSEKLTKAASLFPPQSKSPVLAPISSIMGEIMFVAVYSTKHDLTFVRSWVDQHMRYRLQAVSGVANVSPIGGDVKQYQILLRPQRLQKYGWMPEDIVEKIQQANTNRWGGLLVRGGREYSISALGRFRSPRDIEQLTLGTRNGIPVRLSDVAVVRVGAEFRRGSASYDARSAVVLGIQKQPAANTLVLTQELDRVMNELQQSLPPGMTISRKSFRQEQFIRLAIRNVQNAMLEGAVLVILVLMLFLLHARATFISVVTIPLSMAVAFLVLQMLGATINTMTLGGITVAIGALVDDAVIDVENVVRHLRLRQELPVQERASPLLVVFLASREIRSSILFATLILMLVFLPIFFLEGVEGRLLRPLGLAYLIAIFASLVVALTLTPVLSYYLLAHSSHPLEQRESWIVRGLQRLYHPSLVFCLRYPRWMITISSLLAIASVVALFFLGRSFLPPFNEGSLVVSVTTMPGTSLAFSDRLGTQVEQALLRQPEVVSTTRRTGRAELDEHVQGVYAGEIDVVLQMKQRSMKEFLQVVRTSLAAIPGVMINIGQPISHRIDHMLSGSRSAIAIKVFGPDLLKLRALGEEIRKRITTIPGLVDVELEPMIQEAQYQILPRTDMLALHGLDAGALMRQVELALPGVVTSHVREGILSIEVLVRYQMPLVQRVSDLEQLPVFTKKGTMLPLRQLAHIRYAWGPNQILREAGKRRIILGANLAGADLVGAVKQIQQKLQGLSLPSGYHIEYSGQFEREASSRSLLLMLGAAVGVGIFLMLMMAFRSTRLAWIVLVNLPLALIGSVVTLWVTGQVISVAVLVGWITLFGIATRNGIILVSHFQHLRYVEKLPLEQAVIQGSLDRLNPILMTALTTGLAAIPLMLASTKPGNELQSPMAFVIFGGLFSSTFLNMLLLPVLYLRYAAGLSDTTQDE